MKFADAILLSVNYLGIATATLELLDSQMENMIKTVTIL
jgi:hypothetical protein